MVSFMLKGKQIIPKLRVETCRGTNIFSYTQLTNLNIYDKLIVVSNKNRFFFNQTNGVIKIFHYHKSGYQRGTQMWQFRSHT